MLGVNGAGVDGSFDVFAGRQGLMNRRFRKVRRPEPNTLIRYCRLGNVSTMVPCLVHFLFCSWMSTCVPTHSVGSERVCLLYRSWITLFFSAYIRSRSSAATIHSLCRWYWPLCVGMLSFSCRWNKIWAGLRFMSGSGVLRYSRRALRILSLFNEPSEEMLLCNTRFIVLTPASARPFDCGYATDDRR